MSLTYADGQPITKAEFLAIMQSGYPLHQHWLKLAARIEAERA